MACDDEMLAYIPLRYNNAWPHPSYRRKLFCLSAVGRQAASSALYSSWLCLLYPYNMIKLLCLFAVGQKAGNSTLNCSMQYLNKIYQLAIILQWICLTTFFHWSDNIFSCFFREFLSCVMICNNITVNISKLPYLECKSIIKTFS